MGLRAAVQVDIKQATSMKQIYNVVCGQLESSMSTEQRARLRSCGGVGAGSFLEGPPDDGSELSNELWQTATRHRIGLKWPAP
eukprot:10102867-Alexandrium_andersonii.AAC.1